MCAIRRSFSYTVRNLGFSYTTTRNPGYIPQLTLGMCFNYNRKEMLYYNKSYSDYNISKNTRIQNASLSRWCSHQ